MDLRKIKKLIDLLNSSGIGEIEITNKDGESVRISTQSSISASSVNAPAQQIIYPSATAPAAEPTETAPSVPVGHEERSPMVGTIYLAGTPGAKPFVEIGQHVTKGTTLCTIEAMKVYNPIVATADGTVSARLIENASPVEFNDILFVITPD